MSIRNCPNCGTSIKSGNRFCPSCGGAIGVREPYFEVKDQFLGKIDEGTIELMGLVEIGLGVFSLVIGLFFSLFALMFIPMLEEAPMEGISVFFLTFLFVFLLTIPYGIGAIIFGLKLRRFEEGGRTGTMIIAVLSLPNVPLGSAFGLGALYVLTKPEVAEFFRSMNLQPKGAHF